MKLRTLAAAAAMITAGNANAHHSGAMFDYSVQVPLYGYVIGMEWVAPHAWLSIMASTEPGGELERWDIEAVGPPRLTQLGFTQEDFEEGRNLGFLVSPLRDGRNGASLLSVTFPDGTVKDAGANAQANAAGPAAAAAPAAADPEAPAGAAPEAP